MPTGPNTRSCARRQRWPLAFPIGFGKLLMWSMCSRDGKGARTNKIVG